MSFKMLIYGDTGTGKTFSAYTLFNTPYKIRFLSAENNAVEGMREAKKFYESKNKKKVENLSIMIPERPKRNLAGIVESQQGFLNKTLESQLLTSDPDRKKYTRYLEILKGMLHFVDTDTKESHGCIDTWGNDIVFIVDSLTIICEAIKQSVLGSKIKANYDEWAAMQNLLMQLILQLTEELSSNVVLIAHPKKDNDTGKIYPSSVGIALDAIIPTRFSEVVWSYRRGSTFYWSTNDIKAVTRNVHLPISSKLEQNYMKYFNFKAKS